MPQPLGHRRALAAVSAAQLATELAGMVVGLRRRHPYDVFWMHGDPATITRDAVFRGTALSAPVPNMLIQAAMTAVVVRWPSRRAAQALGGWGALMVAGYLGERLVRQRLRPSGWDALESPLLVAAIGLAVAMAVLGPARLAPDAGALLQGSHLRVWPVPPAGTSGATKIGAAPAPCGSRLESDGPSRSWHRPVFRQGGDVPSLARGQPECVQVVPDEDDGKEGANQHGKGEPKAPRAEALDGDRSGPLGQ
jgi:hypothetical protein